MKKMILLAALCASVANAEECTGPNGAYAGFGYAADLRSNAAFAYRGHAYGGYRLCNGLQVEFRHTSKLGSDDGIDLDNDHENDLATSENSLGAYFTHWF